LLATASITLVQEKGDQKGFLGFLPVYDGAPTSAAARTKLLKGFMLGVFRVGDIFQSAAFRENPGGIGHAAVSLIDESADAGNPVLHRQSSADDSRLLHQFSYRKSLKNIAGRNWVMVATPTGTYISAQRSWQPLVALVVGLTFTALLSVYLRLISTRTAQVERLVERRTNELLEANTELVRLSRIDGLTGVANRRVFDAGFAKEWKRAFRDTTPLSLLMIDVDGFKLFNDHYGHQAGDDCLKSIAGSLKTAARRPADVVARYGGEEFVIMLSSTDSDSAAEIAESIRARIEALAIPHEKSPLSDVVTVSIGVDAVTPVIGVTPHSLIERADQALYQAKNSGRNTVVTARAPAVEANGTSRELIGLRS
jgi:diguanylate cyclase (GGDEF)-like protein